jgi:hypothetical protein
MDPRSAENTVSIIESCRKLENISDPD